MIDFEEFGKKIHREALASAKEKATQMLHDKCWIRLADGSLYDYGANMEDYLTSQCAMLADQNIGISAETLYELQPDSDRRYSFLQVQNWLDRHPHYARGEY